MIAHAPNIKQRKKVRNKSQQNLYALLKHLPNETYFTLGAR